MKRIKQRLFHPKTRSIAHYSPPFWVKNALFSTFHKSHLGFLEVPNRVFYPIMSLLMSKISVEDKILFANATKNTVVNKDKYVINLSKKKQVTTIKINANNQNNLKDFSLKQTLNNDNYITNVSAHQSMFFQQPGIRQKDIKKLKSGLFNIKIIADLHGKTEILAEQHINIFIQEAIMHKYKYGLLIHGKGYNSNLDKPVLKNLSNQMLSNTPYILAFCSAQPRDGGTGAVYILFKS